jgi:hypothetical protein
MLCTCRSVWFMEPLTHLGLYVTKTKNSPCKHVRSCLVRVHPFTTHIHILITKH